MRNICNEFFLVIVDVPDLSDHVAYRIGKTPDLVVALDVHRVIVIALRVLDRRVPDLPGRIDREEIDPYERKEQHSGNDQKSLIDHVHVNHGILIDL